MTYAFNLSTGLPAANAQASQASDHGALRVLCPVCKAPDWTFEKGEETMWECCVCDPLVIDNQAPGTCAICGASRSCFEGRKENY